MEPPFKQRRDELLADCQVPPDVFRGAVRRMKSFAYPSSPPFPAPRTRSIHGSISPVSSPSSRPRMRSHRQSPRPRSPEPSGLRRIFALRPPPLLNELNRQMARNLGSLDAVIVFDLSAFPKKGATSVSAKQQSTRADSRTTTRHLTRCQR